MYDKKPVNLPTPKASKSYGNIYFLEQVANNIGLTDILKNIFKDEYDVLIVLVHYIICVDSSLSNSIKWMKLTEMSSAQKKIFKAFKVNKPIIKN